MNAFSTQIHDVTMIPNLISDTGRWLDRFSEVLERWETLLDQVQADYLFGDYSNILRLTPIGEGIHAEIQICKEEREKLLVEAKSLGYFAHSLRDLSVQLDSQWPALWSHRLSNLELQLNRIQQLSMSLWVTAFQSKSFVTEMLLILSTGSTDLATYAPNESHSHEGGLLINEAA